MSIGKKLTDNDVRIIYLPPMTIASIHLVGNPPIENKTTEERTAEYINNYIKENNLAKIKPDFRHFGFNNPDNIQDNNPKHGYERWVSIPEDMLAKEPFVKKKFYGGIYAAHMIHWGSWDEGWLPLHDWAGTDDKYEYDMRLVDSAFDGTCGWLEEHLNYINYYDKYVRGDTTLQLDLLIPIKKKNE
jgi:DNA gyrase inhibitor GyrI